MDAERLIRLSRHALAQSQAVSEIVVEAWQAQTLAQAIGGRLVVYGPPELRGEARGLSEIGGRSAGTPDLPGGHGGIRASLLSGVVNPRETLTALGALLGDVGIALVGVACATDEEGMYWQCIEAMDAADESNDRVRAMLRRLAAKDLEAREVWRSPGTVRERAGPVREASEPPVPEPPVPEPSVPEPAVSEPPVRASPVRELTGSGGERGGRVPEGVGRGEEDACPAREGGGPAGPAGSDGLVEPAGWAGPAGASASERAGASGSTHVPRPPLRPGVAPASGGSSAVEESSRLSDAVDSAAGTS